MTTLHCGDDRDVLDRGRASPAPQEPPRSASTTTHENEDEELSGRRWDLWSRDASDTGLSAFYDRALDRALRGC